MFIKVSPKEKQKTCQLNNHLTNNIPLKLGMAITLGRAAVPALVSQGGHHELNIGCELNMVTVCYCDS